MYFLLRVHIGYSMTAKLRNSWNRWDSLIDFGRYEMWGTHLKHHGMIESSDTMVEKEIVELMLLEQLRPWRSLRRAVDTIGTIH
jgi:hypothetical protein